MHQLLLDKEMEKKYEEKNIEQLTNAFSKIWKICFEFFPIMLIIIIIQRSLVNWGTIFYGRDLIIFLFIL